ncbi:hypothetical protein AAFA46_00690 [Oscillospiraceae bacterium WX1]
MIKLELDVSVADYGSLAEQFLPQIAEKLKGSNNPAAKLLSGGASSAVAKMILSKLPKAALDQLTAELINTNQEQIKKALEKLAEQQNIHLQISRLTAAAAGQTS